MFANYLQIAPWAGIILGGLIGCFLVGLLAVQRGAPMSAVSTNPGKLLWSVIFAIPIPFLLQLAGSMIPGLILAFVWLTVAPSVGVMKVWPPSRPISTAQLFIGNGIWAILTLIVFMLVVGIFG